ncbi:MAG: redoxin [Robiginitomaculum sp.]|nr:MAG: redoxin [Robiginitomaculum sp.]
MPFSDKFLLQLYSASRGAASVVIASFLMFGVAHAKAPEIALDMAEHKGKVIYVDFWASWCGPCQQSFPFMNDLAQNYPQDDFEIILINVDKDREKADQFLSQIQAPCPTLYDPQGKIARQFDIKSMPTSVLIDRKGKIRYVHSGYHDDKTTEYTSHIKELIDENSQ